VLRHNKDGFIVWWDLFNISADEHTQTGLFQRPTAVPRPTPPVNLSSCDFGPELFRDCDLAGTSRHDSPCSTDFCFYFSRGV
jgi:hypothetical protein